MAGYVSVRSNWSSVDSISLDLVCDIDIEERNSSTITDKPDENDARKTTSTNENITHVILRANEAEKLDDPVLILSVIQPEEYQIISLQLLSNARHIEFYHQEYLGSCQGSRITELDNDSIYESIFEFSQSHQELTLKCLKLADKTDLIIYCLQISLMKTQANPSSMTLPFDLNRVRSMIDENNLSQNARQFMNDLQHIQEQRQSKASPSQQFNLGSLMTLMKGIPTSSPDTRYLSPTALPSTFNELKSALNEERKSSSNQNSDNIKQEFHALETRLQSHIDKRFVELQHHIDQRLNQLEEKLITHSNR